MAQRDQKDPSASVRVMGDITLIMLTKGYVAVIDTADLDLVEGHHWWAKIYPTNVYACRSTKTKGKHRKELMHRALIGARKGELVDHRDGKGLHNQRANLRHATHSQNVQNVGLRSINTSGLKGVSWHQCGKWRAQIQIDGKNRHLGLFDTKEEAHARYCGEAKSLFGDYARTS